MTPQSNSSAPDRRRPAAGALTPLPPRAQPGTTKREQRQIFEQVKTQVLTVAVASLEQTLRILKNWMKEE
jgi:hypothetical protein